MCSGPRSSAGVGGGRIGRAQRSLARCVSGLASVLNGFDCCACAPAPAIARAHSLVHAPDSPVHAPDSSCVTQITEEWDYEQCPTASSFQCSICSVTASRCESAEAPFPAMQKRSITNKQSWDLKVETRYSVIILYLLIFSDTKSLFRHILLLFPVTNALLWDTDVMFATKSCFQMQSCYFEILHFYFEILSHYLELYLKYQVNIYIY